MAETFSNFLPYINIIIGSFLILIGFKVINPIELKKQKQFYEQWGTFFKLGGCAMFLWGVVELLQKFGIIS